MSSRLRMAEVVAGLGAAALLATTFAPWFKVRGAELNVWNLSIARWFIFLAILSAAWMVIAALFADSARWSVILSTPTGLFGISAAIGLVYRLINPPGGFSVTSAFYAAVAGGLLLLAGGLWAIRDDSSPPAFDNSPEPEIVHLESAP